MLSSKRRIRRKACQGKKAYRTTEEANKAAAHLRAHGENVHSYHCPHCHQFHCGHIPSRVTTKEARRESRAKARRIQERLLEKPFPK